MLRGYESCAECRRQMAQERLRALPFAVRLPGMRGATRAGTGCQHLFAQGGRGGFTRSPDVAGG